MRAHHQANIVAMSALWRLGRTPPCYGRRAVLMKPQIFARRARAPVCSSQQAGRRSIPLGARRLCKVTIAPRGGSCLQESAATLRPGVRRRLGAQTAPNGRALHLPSERKRRACCTRPQVGAPRRAAGLSAPQPKGCGLPPLKAWINRSNAACANARMLSIRSLRPVSSVITCSRGPTTAIHACPGGSP
jgi:hypothetical protein